MLGYINRDIAEDLAPKIDENRLGVICFASDVTGGDADCYIGVNLLLVVGPIDAPDAELYALAAETFGIKIRKAQLPKPRKPRKADA